MFLWLLSSLVTLTGCVSLAFFALRLVQFAQRHFLRGAQQLARYGAGKGYWAGKLRPAGVCLCQCGVCARACGGG